MFGRMKEFLSGEDATLEVDKNGEVSERDIQISCAALMLCMTSADGNTDNSELQSILDLMKKEFSLEDVEEVVGIIEAADIVRQDCQRIDQVCSVINQSFSVEQKQKVMTMIWTIVQADGVTERSEAQFATSVRTKLGLSMEQAAAAQAKVGL